MSRDVPKKDNVPTLEVGKMKTRQDV